MYKVIKDLSNPPSSLNSEETDRMREEIIRQRKYPTEVKKYNERYKQEDIKDALLKIYNKKCAYCEKSVADTFFPIEHYRPKSKYYWLAYSWANLLLCCHECNTYKGKKFEIEAGKEIEFDESDLKNIHNLTQRYNEIEKPLLINPELEDIEDKLIFNIETGKIESKDRRCQHTIACCKLDRCSANDNRHEIWKEFCDNLKAVMYRIKLSEDGKKHYDAYVELKALIRKFREDAFNPEKEYLTFRRYIIRSHKIFLSSL